MKEDEINALVVGAEADVIISGQMGFRVFKPTDDYSTAFEIEVLVYDDGQHEEYASALKAIVVAESELDPDWLLAHATPLQRCKAFLMLSVEA